MAENAEEQLKIEMIAQGMDVKSDEAWFKMGASQSNPQLKLCAFQKAVKISKKNSDAWNGIGLLVATLGEKEEAYRNAIKANPKFAEAWYNLGLILEDSKEKLKAFQTVINLDQKFGNAYIELIKLAKDEKQKASLLNTAMQYDPENENIYIALADVFLEVNEKLQILRKGVQNCRPSERLWLKLGQTIPDEAGQIQTFKKVLELNPSNLFAWEQIIRRTIHDAELKQWVLDFGGRQHNDLKSQIAPALKNTLTSVVFRKFIDEVFASKDVTGKSAGNRARDSERTREEINAVITKKINELGFPSYVGRSWINLAAILSADEEKVVALERGLGIDPSIGEGWTMLGYAYKDVAQKKLAFQRAIGINPQDVHAWKGVAKVVTSDPERVFCYQRVLEIAPNDQESREFLEKLGIIEGKQVSPPPPEFTAPLEINPLQVQDLNNKSILINQRDDELFQRRPIDTSDLQVNEILESIRAEHKLYFEETATQLKTPPRNFKAFFTELANAKKVIGDFSLTGTSFSFDKGLEKISLANLVKAFDAERDKAEEEHIREAKRREIARLNQSGSVEEVVKAEDLYDTEKQSKSISYAGRRFDLEAGIAFIEGDPQQGYHTTLSQLCLDCHKRLFKYDTLCRWCGTKLAKKILIRAASGVVLPLTPEVPQEMLQKFGPIDVVEQVEFHEYPVIIIIEATGVKERDLFNNLEMTVPHMLFCERVNVKAMQQFYKKNGWDTEMPDFLDNKDNFWLFAIGKTVGKKDMVECYGRFLEAVPGVRVLRIDFINSDTLQIHQLRMKYR